MKMRKAEHFVRSSSSIAGQTFSVKMSDKLFETLFSTLYKYKEAAALRETLCNALDSHNMRDRQQNFVASHYMPLTPPPARYSRYMAPKGTPVIVHLPDDMEPWLEIKDFGIGLALEQIVGDVIPAHEDEVLIEGNVVVKEDEIPDGSAVIGIPGFYGDNLVFRSEDEEIIRTPGLYTTLFNSTKENDDGQIGAFGLGSKSPFAVSDTFTVESRYEGKLYRFLMYLNKDRIPTVDIITKDLVTRDPTPEDTEEFNGMTIRIPIKNSRYQAFENELVRLGKVMRPDVRPVVENSMYSFEWEDIEFGDRVWKTYIQPKENNDHNHYAVMGGVSYPINLDQLSEDIQSVMSRFPSSYTFFELGELNVPPSREDLSYDDYTRQNLNDTLRKAVNEIVLQRKRELQIAEARGPLALFVAKGRISDIYGAGFRKMLDKEFPTDVRFYDNKFVVPDVPEVDRDWNASGDYFVTVGQPFSVEVFDKEFGDGGDSVLRLNTMYRWMENGIKPLIIIDDNKHARNLKIATARKYNPVVIVATLNDAYLSRRNTAMISPAIKNNLEIVQFINKWIGDGEQVNYLVFGDKFCDSLDTLINFGTISMMSELSYEKPTVEKDPGMFPFLSDDRYFNLDSWRELKAKEVSEMIDTGKRIIYLTFSGYECTHKIRDYIVNASALSCINNLMRGIKFEVESDGDERKFESFFDYMNIHTTIVLARRKSVPMMKKHPEVFIPIDEVFDILVENSRDILDKTQATGIIKSLTALKIQSDRLGYGKKLLEESFGVDAVPEDYQECFDNHTNVFNQIMNMMTPEEMDSLKKTANMNIEREMYKKRVYNLLMKAVGEIRCTLPANALIEKTRALDSRCYDIFYSASNILYRHGFCELNPRKTPSLSQRRENRLTVERHRVVKFLRAHYVTTKENPIEERGSFLEIISKTIIKGILTL